LKAKINSLEKDNKKLEKDLKQSRDKESKLMTKIVGQQNDYNKLQKEHKLLKQEFDAYKKGNKGGNKNDDKNKKKEEPKTSPKSYTTTIKKQESEKKEDPKQDEKKGKHKKKGSKWSLFGSKKDKDKVMNDEDDKKDNKDNKKSVQKQPTKSAPPPKAAAARKKPTIPKDVVAPKKSAPAPKSKSGGSGGGGSHKNVWDGYVNKFGNVPASASQLQSFSKSNADMPTLNFKQARECYNSNK